MLAAYDNHLVVIAAAEAKKAAMIKAVTDAVASAAQEIYELEVGTAPQELAELHEELTEFLVDRRPALMRRFKKIITRPMGEVRYVHDEPEMDWPKDEDPVVRYFENHKDGLQFLTFPRPKLDKKAILKNATPEMLAELRPLGVWKGQHLFVKFKTSSMAKLTTLVRRRYKEQPVRTKK